MVTSLGYNANELIVVLLGDFFLLLALLHALNYYYLFSRPIDASLSSLFVVVNMCVMGTYHVGLSIPLPIMSCTLLSFYFALCLEPNSFLPPFLFVWKNGIVSIRVVRRTGC